MTKEKETKNQQVLEKTDEGRMRRLTGMTWLVSHFGSSDESCERTKRKSHMLLL